MALRPSSGLLASCRPFWGLPTQEFDSHAEKNIYKCCIYVLNCVLLLNLTYKKVRLFSDQIRSLFAGSFLIRGQFRYLRVFWLEILGTLIKILWNPPFVRKSTSKDAEFSGANRKNIGHCVGELWKFLFSGKKTSPAVYLWRLLHQPWAGDLSEPPLCRWGPSCTGFLHPSAAHCP